MGKKGIRYAAKVDLEKDAATQPQLHVIPFAGTIKNEEVVKIQCVDWTGGQIGNNDSADDVRDVDLSRIHYLTGPFEIETAEPGDVLVVEIQDVQPLQDEPWGFTGIFSKENGGGFLDEIFPKPWVMPESVSQLDALLMQRDAVPKQSGILRASTAPPATFPEFASLV
ncbi:hypothetical protein LTS10_001733 [Elasticomyces elasticus]|nr:hypothetical protein LTS10_001733 [Elasticomyces elasticus]